MCNFYSLRGFIDLFDVIPNFVFPVFENGGTLFFQNGCNDRIEEFVEVKRSVYSKLIPLESGQAGEVVINRTSNPIYAFRESANKIEFGNAAHFIRYFQNYLTEDVLLEKRIKDFLGEIGWKREETFLYQSKNKYFYGTGRRKSSTARIFLFPYGTGIITINGRDIDEYFGLETLKVVVRQPLVATANEGKVDIVATVKGGGVSGQAGALRHGISRALAQFGDENRPVLRQAGLLTRDPRMKERKKYGLKGARRAPQYSKR